MKIIKINYKIIIIPTDNPKKKFPASLFSFFLITIS